MRHYRGSLLLLTILAALGAFVYFYETRGLGASAPVTEQEAQIFAHKEEEITSIEWRDGQKSVTLSRDSSTGRWQRVGAENADADEWTVTTLLWRLAHLNADRIVAEKIDVPANYGLDQPQMELRLGLAGGQKETLYLGNENPRGTGSYARKEGADALYLVNASVVTDLRKLGVDPSTPTPEAAAPATPDAQTPQATPAEKP